jgi:hypothetical protein
MNVDLKNSRTTLQRRVSDRTMKVCLAVLAGLGVIALPSRADADNDTPSCHSIPTASVTATDAPQINILAPILDRPLVSPLDIELQFVPATTDAAVRADTFRVCYVGFLTVDITKRVTDSVTVSPNGVHVSGAQLPHGRHHLVMLISDQDGRIGRRDASLEIQ